MQTKSTRIAIGHAADRVIDDAETDETVAQLHYDITSFGADYDVDGLVKRMKKDEILVPPFQRGYVWNLKEASRFVESLLLGLPVPGIFLAKEASSNKFLVIDGQQRLRTLQFFYEGFFDPKPIDKAHKIFKLINVQKQYEGRTYKALEEKDRIQLDNSIIHATIIKQDSPPGENTSIFHVFERLNTGGLKLAAQEVRVATYHGTLMDLIRNLNEYSHWRSIYGKPSPRSKDQELILRFLALYADNEKYEKPMSEFLNKFSGRHRDATSQFLEQCRNTFTSTIELVSRSLGSQAFRPERSLNAAVFDSVMVGVAKRLELGPIKKIAKISTAYDELLKNSKYMDAISRATSDELNVSKRLQEAISTFKRVE